MPALAGRLLPYFIRCALRGIRIDNHAVSLLLQWRASGVPVRLADSLADIAALRGTGITGGLV